MTGDNRISKTWRIDPDLSKRAAEVAEARGCTVTELVEQGLRLVCDGEAADLHRAVSDARRDLLSIRAVIDARLEALLEPGARDIVTEALVEALVARQHGNYHAVDRLASAVKTALHDEIDPPAAPKKRRRAP